MNENNNYVKILVKKIPVCFNSIVYSERPGEASLYFHRSLPSLFERSSPMAFFLSVGVPSILSPVESHDNSQPEGSGGRGGGGLHPLLSDLWFFLHNLTEFKNLST